MEETLEKLINIMITVAKAYINTGRSLKYTLESLEHRREALQKKLADTTFRRSHEKVNNTFLYLNYGINDVRRRLGQLLSLMDSTEMRKATEQLFDLIEYYLQVQKQYARQLASLDKTGNWLHDQRDSLEEEVLLTTTINPPVCKSQEEPGITTSLGNFLPQYGYRPVDSFGISDGADKQEWQDRITHPMHRMVYDDEVIWLLGVLLL